MLTTNQCKLLCAAAAGRFLHSITGYGYDAADALCLQAIAEHAGENTGLVLSNQEQVPRSGLEYIDAVTPT